MNSNSKVTVSGGDGEVLSLQVKGCCGFEVHPIRGEHVVMTKREHCQRCIAEVERYVATARKYGFFDWKIFHCEQDTSSYRAQPIRAVR